MRDFIKVLLDAPIGAPASALYNNLRLGRSMTNLRVSNAVASRRNIAGNNAGLTRSHGGKKMKPIDNYFRNLKRVSTVLAVTTTTEVLQVTFQVHMCKTKIRWVKRVKHAVPRFRYFNFTDDVCTPCD